MPGQHISHIQPITKQYYPSDVHNAVLYRLHATLNFIGIHQLEHSIKIKFGEDEIDVVQRSRGYEFIRPSDGERIIYFETVRDAKDKELADDNQDKQLRLSAKTFAQALVKQGFITPGCTIIAPLVLVKDNRKHFNTLVICADRSNDVHATVIEPRSSHRYWGKKLTYPIAKFCQSIQRCLKGAGSATVHVTPITIGQQDVKDNTTCGAHHINFVEVIATHLKGDYLLKKNEGRLKRILARVPVLSRRYTDADKSKYVNAVLNDPERMVNAAIQGGGNLRQEYFDARGFIADQKLQSAGDCLDPQNPDNPVARHKVLHTMIKAHEQRTDPLTYALGRINGYSAHCEKNKENNIRTIFCLFPYQKHTRKVTADHLVNLLETIKDGETDEKTKCYTATYLLFQFYANIASHNSLLRDQIEKALAKLLDCQVEYAVICKDDFSGFGRYNSAMPLFEKRLDLMNLSTPDGVRKAHRVFKAEVSRLAKEICVDDESLKYKFNVRGKVVEDVDAKRTQRFSAIETALQTITVKDAVAQNDAAPEAAAAAAIGLR